MQETSFKEEVWSRERKYVKEEREQNVVAVFVEVDATCPDQVPLKNDTYSQSF